MIWFRAIGRVIRTAFAADPARALLVFIGTQFVFNLRDFALVNIVLVLVWLVVVAGIIRLKKSKVWESEAGNKAA